MSDISTTTPPSPEAFIREMDDAISTAMFYASRALQVGQGDAPTIMRDLAESMCQCMWGFSYGLKALNAIEQRAASRAGGGQ